MAKSKKTRTHKRPYEDTSVSVVKSRADIDGVLHKHGVENTQWTTGTGNITLLRFIFEYEGASYTVRYLVDPRRQGKKWERFSTRMTEERHWEKEAMMLHRVLHFAVKSNLEVIESGLMDPVAVWLPQIEAGERTVRERIEADISALNSPTATLMLTEAKP